MRHDSLFCSSWNETHVPFQSPFPLSKTLSSSSFSSFPLLLSYPLYKIRSLSNKTHTVFLDLPCCRLPSLRDILPRSLRSRRSPSNKTHSVLIHLVVILLALVLSFFFFLLSLSLSILYFLTLFLRAFFHARPPRPWPRVLHARTRACVQTCVRAKVPRFSTESVESHLLLFPTRSLCPSASTCISAILGSLHPTIDVRNATTPRPDRIGRDDFIRSRATLRAASRRAPRYNVRK